LSLASTPPLRMGPPPRSFAADAHACIMVRVTATHRIQGCGASASCPTASSPRMCHPDHSQPAAVLGSIKARPGTTERAAQAERRPALTAPVRAGLRHVWVGAKKRDFKSNKETGMKEVRKRRMS
jgi:hypothetical protein